MKITLEFETDEEVEARMAVDATNMARAIGRIRDELFRPVRKHGYPDPVIEALVVQTPGLCINLIGLLEEKFSNILIEEDVIRYD